MTSRSLETRQLTLNKANTNNAGACVLYVMARDQRTEDNFALLIAQEKAMELELPLVVQFNLLAKSGVRAREHFSFMLDGLQEVAKQLAGKNISFVLTHGNPKKQIATIIQQTKPAHIYFDFSPLRGVRHYQKAVARDTSIPCSVVDAHNIVPVWIASDKQEFAAHTLRKKIQRHLESYLVEPSVLQKHSFTFKKPLHGISFSDARKYIEKNNTSGIAIQAASGESNGREYIKTFLEERLSNYAEGRNDIARDMQSGLSPYLHYGQVSSLRVALETMYDVDERPLLFDYAKMAQPSGTLNKQDGMNVLFEEMIVRKELSDNFCLYAHSYTSISAANDWAKDTLKKHENDPREHIYSAHDLEHANTHDAAWNAAQTQLRTTGNIHGYMRMYWAKKLLEWTKTPQDAVDIALYLNDHYSIDGGDPNGYVGILWSIAGIHDRPWIERPIFGKIRYMNASGLKRKFDVDAYIKAWQK